jgi:predicted CXXCH cytochrome family protein
MGKAIRTAVIVLGFCLAAAIPATAEPKENSHNTGDCLFCHRTTPRFGIDTLATVTFNEVEPDDPALCWRCHKPEENLHPESVKPDPAKGTVASKNLPLGTSERLQGMVVCTTCHFIHAADADFSLLRGFPGSQEAGLYKSWQSFCRDCHGENLLKRSPHAGGDAACAFCHLNQPVKGQVPAVAPRGVELCNLCHGGIQNDHFVKANPFPGPVGCSSCHDPHLGPDRTARLKDAYLEAARDQVTIDPHYRKALCFACHKPVKDLPLLTDDPVKLCNRCHGSGRIIGEAHPVRPVPAGAKMPKDWPLKNGSLTCLTCHLAGHPKDRGGYKFLRGTPYKDRNDICTLCHDMAAYQKTNPHLDVTQLKGCEFCHIGKPVPGKDTVKTVRLLAQAELLCVRCHPETAHPGSFNHTTTLPPERVSTIPSELPLLANKMSCTTCHNPHLSETGNYKLRGTVTGFEICGNCHRY